MPQDVMLADGYSGPFDVGALWERFQGLHRNGPYVLAADVFRCAFAFAAENPTVSR